MEYLDLLQGLSSGDSLTRVSTVARIIHVMKTEKSTNLVNTIALRMAVQFSGCSNRDRYLISTLFE